MVVLLVPYTVVSMTKPFFRRWARSCNLIVTFNKSYSIIIYVKNNLFKKIALHFRMKNWPWSTYVTKNHHISRSITVTNRKASHSMTVVFTWMFMRRILKICPSSLNINSASCWRWLKVNFGIIFVGLTFLNSNGILHRDLKPDNIVVDKQLRSKIIDFGSSCNVYQWEDKFKPFDSTCNIFDYVSTIDLRILWQIRQLSWESTIKHQAHAKINVLKTLLFRHLQFWYGCKFIVWFKKFWVSE